MGKINTKDIGNFGEKIAEEYLKEKGFITLTKNYTKRCGEIDIISKYENYIVFTEVKTRKLNSMLTPVEAVTKSKIDKIFKTAYMYLNENKCELQPRFDIVEVTVDTQNMTVKEINHIENALWQEGDYAVF